jgi:hypothetical protein
MAPLTSYLETSVTDEVALARSAAPESISAKAEVLTLGNHGYVTASRGSDGFVCLVERSWAKGFADTEFWNPKLRAPTCYNEAAAKSVLPRYLERTAWILSGVSKADMIARTRSELSSKKFTLPEPGAMSYMMSRQGHLSDAGGHWHPHVMFYVANTGPAAWGANLAGSPIVADDRSIFSEDDSPEPIVTFMVPLAQWSDGTHEVLDTH